MEVGGGARPIPDRDHDVALDALRPVRPLFGQFACCDPVGPVGQAGQEAAIFGHQLVDAADHGGAGLSLPQSCPPGGLRVLVTNPKGRIIHGAHDGGADLVTVAATVLLEAVHPVQLALHCDRHAVAIRTRAREQTLVRNLKHRPPIGAGIVLRGCAGRGRDGGREVERHAWLGWNARRIDQPEAADPDVVLCPRRKGGQQVAPLIVGDHDLGVPFRAQACRLGDDPHAGFRSFGARHNSSDVVGTNPKLLGANLARPKQQERSNACRTHVRAQGSFRTHVNLRIEISMNRLH